MPQIQWRLASLLVDCVQLEGEGLCQGRGFRLFGIYGGILDIPVFVFNRQMRVVSILSPKANTHISFKLVIYN